MIRKQLKMSLAQPPEVGSAAETAAAARAGHRSTLPLAAERDSLVLKCSVLKQSLPNSQFKLVG